MHTATAIAAKLERGDGPLHTMLWIVGGVASCVRGAFTRDAGRAALLELEPDARPFWLSEWPEGIAPQGRGVTFATWQMGGSASGSVIDEALVVVSTAKGMAETSAVELTKRLGAMEETARRQSGAVSELAEIFNQSSHEATLSTSLSSLFTALNELRSNLASEQHNHHYLVGEAAGTVTQLAQLSATISHFATSSRLATFNARLEAARLGEAGSGFLSIAGALFELAQQVTAASANTTLLTQKLSRLLPQLSASSQHVKTQLEAEMSSLTVRVTELKKQLADSERLARGKLEAACLDGEALTGEMNAAMAELQSTDRLSQLLSAMHEAFVRAQAGQSAAFSEFEARKDSLVSQQVLASAGSIELF